MKLSIIICNNSKVAHSLVDTAVADMIAAAVEIVDVDNMVAVCTVYSAEGTALNIAVAETVVGNMAVVCIEQFVEGTALDTVHSSIVFVLELVAHKPDSLVVV